MPSKKDKGAAKAQELPAMTGPGVEPLKVPAIDAALEEYVPVRERRMRETPKEVEKKKAVLEAFHASESLLPKTEAGEPYYRWGDKRWVLKRGKESVRSVADEDAELD
jgi:hypothetical protein